MKISKIAKKAKNLLEDKTCENCSFKTDKLCFKKLKENHIESLGRDLPEENTCERWKEMWEITYQSIPLNLKAKKLHIKWTMESELEIIKMMDVSIKELLKATKKEIDGNR